MTGFKTLKKEVEERGIQKDNDDRSLPANQSSSKEEKSKRVGKERVI